MMRRLTLTLLIAAAVAVAGPAWAQPRTIEIRNLSPLSFGSFASPATSGQVTVTPDGSRTVSGVVPVGTDTFGAASFEVRISGGNPNYVITLPTSITLTGPSGSMTINNVQSLPAGTGFAQPPARVGTVTVGGTLNINSMQPSGAYTATFPVTVHLGN